MYTNDQYNESARLAVQAAKIHRDSGNLYVIPLYLLYDCMTERKEINTIYQIGQDQKLKFWTLACLQEPGSGEKRKIRVAQAFYMLELINQKSDV